MRKKNGFTLVEVISVIAVLVVIAAISIPAIISIGEKNKEKSYARIVDNIKVSSENFVERNRSEIPFNADGKYYVKLSLLGALDLIKLPIKNPIDGTEFDGSECIEVVKNDDNTLSYNILGKGHSCQNQVTPTPDLEEPEEPVIPDNLEIRCHDEYMVYDGTCKVFEDRCASDFFNWIKFINVDEMRTTDTTQTDTKCRNIEDEEFSTCNFQNMDSGTINVLKITMYDVATSEYKQLLMHIVVTGYESCNSDWSGNLKDKIIADNYVKSNPVYGCESTDKGLFVQQGDETKSIDGKPTYYFRGTVANNYVKFGKFPANNIPGYSGDVFISPVGTDMIWQVVRINEDGSIRLILTQNITKNTAGEYSNQTVLGDWYGHLIKDQPGLASSIVDGGFGSSNTDFTGLATFAQANNWIKKIGELTDDEAIFAVRTLNTNKCSYYGTGGTETINPAYFEFPTQSNGLTSFFYTSSGVLAYDLFDADGSIAVDRNDPTCCEETGSSDCCRMIRFNAGIRPVINISKDTPYVSGSGTKSDPYIVN